jgi:purine-binding chemotaxis protein CheW
VTEILEKQYLTFTIADERYALAVGRVREVLEYKRITKLPCQLPYLKGLIDLRGKGVPVIDMRMRFSLPGNNAMEDSEIVVSELGAGADMRVVGLLADAVHEVIEIDTESVEAPPRFGSGSTGLFLKGIAKGESGFVLILDANRLLETEELLEVASAAKADKELVGA